MSVAAIGVLPGSLLSLGDQSFESGVGGWVAGALASGVATSAAWAFEGSNSLTWTSTGSGACQVVSTIVPATAGLPYIASGVLNVPGTVAGAGFMWWGASGQIGSTVLGPTSATGPKTVAAVAPKGTTGVKLVFYFTATAASQVGYLDLAYLAQSDSQLLVDWVNPAFSASSNAGQAFSDVTPFVNVSANSISMTHGRQDAISEVQNGTLNFTLENSSGWFTQGKSGSPWPVGLGARAQWNVSYQAPNLQADLAAGASYWPLSADATDSTAAHNGTVSGHVIFGQVGPFGLPGARFHSYTNDKISTTWSPSGGAAFSVEAWVRLTAHGWENLTIGVQDNRFVGTGYATSFKDWYLGVVQSSFTAVGTAHTPVAGSPVFAIGNGTVQVTPLGSSAVPRGQWVHMAGTWDGATAKLYVNGALVDSVALAGTLQVPTNPISIGTVTPDNANSIDGAVAGVGVYSSTVLSGTQIANHASGRLALVSQPFVTRFDGAINELGHTVSVDGGYAQVQVNARDVIGYLSQQPALGAWTRQQALLDGPLYHWALDDVANSTAAAETSGNNGPALRLATTGSGSSAVFANSSFGVETQADILPAAGTKQVWGTPLANFYAKAGTVGAGTKGVGSTYLVAKLPQPLKASSAWSVEWYAAFDPAAAANYANANTADMGMVALAGNAGTALQAWANSATGGPNVTAQATVQTNPQTGAVTTVGTVTWLSGLYNATVAVPVHCALVNDGLGTCTLYVAGSSRGTIPYAGNALSSIYSKIVVGDLVSGYCGFAGALSCVSIYNYALSGAQVTAHSNMGQAGPYGWFSGRAIAQIAAYAGLPTFWLDSQVTNNGISQIDYYSIDGQNPLSAMQQAEQAEMGVLYANSAGKLTFASRDFRQGGWYPVATLPPGSFNPELGHKVTDQYVQTSTAIQGGSSAVVAVSSSSVVAQIGQYPAGSKNSPTQLAVLTSAPANTVQAGQVEPYAQDVADWSVNRNSSPRFKATNATIDIKTMANPLSSEFFSPALAAALDVNHAIGVNAANVVSMPDVVGALEFFVEGVTETYTIDAHKIGYYTSPANAGRAWVLGDPVYGVLDSTAVVGIAAENGPGVSRASRANVPGVLNAFDPGGPWFVPSSLDNRSNLNWGPGGPTSGNQEAPAGFVGASDLRGLTKQLQTMLSPPVFSGSIASYTQVTNAWGNLPALTVNVDTYHAYGYLFQSAAYCYVVPVPGFYEICFLTFPHYQGVANDNVDARIVVNDPRAGLQWTVGQSFGGTSTTLAFTEGLWLRTRAYLGIGALIFPQVYAPVGGASATAVMSVEFIGFGPTVD